MNKLSAVVGLFALAMSCGNMREESEATSFTILEKLKSLSENDAGGLSAKPMIMPGGDSAYGLYVFDSLLLPPPIVFGKMDSAEISMATKRLDDLAAANVSSLVRLAEEQGFGIGDSTVLFRGLKGDRVLFCKLVGRGWTSLIDVGFENGADGLYHTFDLMQVMVLDIEKHEALSKGMYYVPNDVLLHGACMYSHYWGNQLESYSYPDPYDGRASFGNEWMGVNAFFRIRNPKPAFAMGLSREQQHSLANPVKGLEDKASNHFAELGLTFVRATTFWIGKNDGRVSHLCAFTATPKEEALPEFDRALVLVYDLETLELLHEGWVSYWGTEIAELDPDASIPLLRHNKAFAKEEPLDLE